MGSIDVVARVHPGGCDATDIDEALSQAAWALRPGGLFVVTLPLGRPGDEDALGPADVRAVVARAHEQGTSSSATSTATWTGGCGRPGSPPTRRRDASPVRPTGWCGSRCAAGEPVGPEDARG